MDGGPIALVCDGDIVTIDAAVRQINLEVDETTLEKRRQEWAKSGKNKLRVKRGALAKYARLVQNASEGAITDLF